MAHGSKRWIKTWDGRIKKSRNRTKLDYYGDLHWWNEREVKYIHRAKKNKFCPQCKHVAKYASEIDQQYRDRKDAIEIEYYCKYGEALQLWRTYDSKWWWVLSADDMTLEEKFQRYRDTPKFPYPPTFNEWLKLNHTESRWTFDYRSYFCYKCEEKYEMKEIIWNYGHLPGNRTRYQYTRKQEYKKYRAEVKSLMQKAKYDEEYYDHISPKKVNGWLD